MNRCTVTARAEADLDAQYLYLAEASGSVGPGDRLVASFESNADFYAGNPDLGSRDLTDDPDLRAFPFGTPPGRRGWIAIYRAVGDGIEIVRVFRGSQDFLAEL